MLKLDNVSLNLDTFSLKDISFSLKEGEYFVILGPSGTGKTVLLEAISGLLKIKKGNIYIENNIINNVPPEKRNIGICYQDYVLFPHLNVFENLAYGMKIKRIPKDKINNRINNLLFKLDIQSLSKRSIKTLSGGEAQRVALGRAIATTPKLLLLDEPLSALDINTKQKLEELLKKINKDFKQTIIHITHDFEEALNLADRIGVMNDGKMIQIGTPDEIFRTPRTKFVADFLGGENLFKVKIIESNGIKLAKIGKVNFQIYTESKSKEGYISIRADEIILSNNPIKTSARNCFKGRVTNIKKRGMIFKISVDIGILLVVLITLKSKDEMNIIKNKEIYCIFKASSIHFFQ